MRRARALALASLAFASAHCGGSSPPPDAAAEPDAFGGLDAPDGPDAAIEPDAAAEPDAAVAGDADVLATGRALYESHCALCHASDGTGYRADNAPAIGRPGYLRHADDAFLEIAIYDGRPGTPMSPWGDSHGGPFARTQARAVVAYVRSFSDVAVEDLSGITVSGDATRGGVLYARECASCHGARGEGVTAPTLDNAVFQDSASDGFLRRSIELGRPDTPMPGFAATLSAQELDDVVTFVRTLRRAPAPMWPIEDPPTLETLVLHPGGAPPSFTLREGRYVPAADVNAALEAGRRMVLLDARATSDWVLGHIPGAAPFPFYSVDELAATLPNDDTWIVAYCACPHAASGRVVDDLRARGFANTAVLDEGIYFWRDAGYPMARGRLP
jgi:mono/diheme cytochrome c family protein/rhodanese-related sulfurtransferase